MSGIAVQVYLCASDLLEKISREASGLGSNYDVFKLEYEVHMLQLFDDTLRPGGNAYLF